LRIKEVKSRIGRWVSLDLMRDHGDMVQGGRVVGGEVKPDSIWSFIVK